MNHQFPKSTQNSNQSDTIYCKTCARKIGKTLFGQHCMGDRHVSLVPNQLCVKGPIGNVNPEFVENYLSQYGVISEKDINEVNGVLILNYTFEDKNACYQIIHQDQIEIEGVGTYVILTWPSKIPVQPINIKAAPKGTSLDKNSTKQQNDDPNRVKMMKVNTEDPEAVKKAILAIITQSTDFNEQVTILQHNLQANSRQLEEKRKVVQADLREALLPVFRFHQIHFFGSSITGLDFQGSDLDVYIGNVRKFSESQVVTLRKIRFQIYRSKKFCDVLLISNAKVPIIKCIHTSTQLCCDLNIKNMLAVNNSQLITYYLDLDPKLRPLMVLIKYWAECCGLKKVNCFSGYALCMLTIFYLQQDPYNLPSVVALQSNAPTNIQDDWNCGFGPLQNFSSSQLQKSSILDLFIGFADYYSNFDYISDVICPYLGRIVKKIDFLNFVSLPDCYRRYKELCAVNVNNLLNVNSAICIEDPFELNRNVAASATFHTVGKFAIVCKSALELASSGADTSLKQLLVTCPTVHLNEISFDLFKTENFNDESGLKWFDLVKEIVMKTLRDVLAYQVNELNHLPQIKYPYNDVDDLSSIERVNYECIGKFNVWERRCQAFKAVQEKLIGNMSQIDKEIAITEQLLKMQQNSAPSKMYLAMFFNKDLQQVTLFPQAHAKFKNFPYISHFLEVKLQSWLRSAEIGTNSTNKELDVRVQQTKDVQKIDKQSPQQAEQTPVLVESSPEKPATIPPAKISPVKLAETSTVKPAAISPVKPAESSPVKSVQSEKTEETLDRAPIDTETPKPIVEESQTNGENAKEPQEQILKETNEQSNVNEDCEDDVPANFFDDFLDKDFMDGLDVVDAWEGPPKESKMESSKELKSKSPKRHKKKTKSKSHERQRRDPEKTKRDIHRDKMNKTQDKKQKNLTDKLSLVETGLVVPGTEMDIDFDTVSNMKSQQNEDGSWERDRERERDRLHREREKERIPEKRRERRSGSRERKRSQHFSRSPLRHEIEIIHNRRRRSVSDRERWIRGKRSHEESPPRPKRKRIEEKKKKSFLEEISEKLNEIPTRPQPYPIVPVPVPAPMQYYPVPQPMPQYDQSFFIGDAFMAPVQPVYSHLEPMTVALSSSNSALQPMKHVNQAQQGVNKAVTIVDNVNETMLQNDAETKEDIDKLFADKKISLSDFLAISAKGEVHSTQPETLQKKIKVISRCQDVVKLMGDEHKFTGRLKVRLSKQQIKNISDNGKHESPLKRGPNVNFTFTTAECRKEGDTFSIGLDNILRKIGIITETIILDDTNADVENKTITSPNYKITNAPPKECEECKSRKATKYSEVGSQAVKDTCTIGTQVNDEDLNPTKGVQKDSLAHLTPAQLMGKTKESPSPVKKQQVPERRNVPPMNRGRPRQAFNDPFMYGEPRAARPLFSPRSQNPGPPRGMSPFLSQMYRGRNPPHSPYGSRY